MRKFILALSLVAAAMTANAQERGFYGNKFTDNWYIGAGGAFSSKTTHQAVFKHINSGIDFKVGKYFSPIFGVGLEANYYFDNKPMSEAVFTETNGTRSLSKAKYYNLGIFASANLMNAIGGYYGEPRWFEIQPMLGFYWGHNTCDNVDDIGTRKNTLVNKFGIDFFFNIGKKKMFQFFIEPSINYAIAGVESENVDENYKGNEIVLYNINNTYLNLNVGLNYKFLTSNGSHNFMVVEACDQTEIDDLNSSINSMRSKSSSDEDKMAELQRENERLRQALKECEDKPAVVVQDEPNPPAVFYECNKSIITPSQSQNVAIAAEILKKHPEMKLQIKGYASPEGPHDNNTSLGIRRANAVKDMLVKKYGISSDRLSTEGCGETDKLFPIFELNRVAMMYLQK